MEWPYLTVPKRKSMKKIWALVLLLIAFGSLSVQAQGGPGGDPAAMMARTKERLKPQLMEKVHLTDAQAEKVVEINFESQRQRRELRELAEGERTKKLAELDAERDKKLAAIPLTPEQVKAVNDFFEEMRRNRPQRGGGGGNRL